MYEEYMTMSACEKCKGKRLRDEALAVTIGDKNIIEISNGVSIIFSIFSLDVNEVCNLLHKFHSVMYFFWPD